MAFNPTRTSQPIVSEIIGEKTTVHVMGGDLLTLFGTGKAAVVFDASSNSAATSLLVGTCGRELWDARLSHSLRTAGDSIFHQRPMRTLDGRYLIETLACSQDAPQNTFGPTNKAIIQRCIPNILDQCRQKGIVYLSLPFLKTTTGPLQQHDTVASMTTQLTTTMLWLLQNNEHRLKDIAIYASTDDERQFAGNAFFEAKRLSSLSASAPPAPSMPPAPAPAAFIPPASAGMPAYAPNPLFAAPVSNPVNAAPAFGRSASMTQAPTMAGAPVTSNVPLGNQRHNTAGPSSDYKRFYSKVLKTGVELIVFSDNILEMDLNGRAVAFLNAATPTLEGNSGTAVNRLISEAGGADLAQRRQEKVINRTEPIKPGKAFGYGGKIGNLPFRLLVDGIGVNFGASTKVSKGYRTLSSLFTYVLGMAEATRIPDLVTVLFDSNEYQGHSNQFESYTVQLKTIIDFCLHPTKELTHLKKVAIYADSEEKRNYIVDIFKLIEYEYKSAALYEKYRQPVSRLIAVKGVHAFRPVFDVTDDDRTVESHQDGNTMIVDYIKNIDYKTASIEDIRKAVHIEDSESIYWEQSANQLYELLCHLVHNEVVENPHYAQYRHKLSGISTVGSLSDDALKKSTDHKTRMKAVRERVQMFLFPELK